MYASYGVVGISCYLICLLFVILLFFFIVYYFNIFGNPVILSDSNITPNIQDYFFFSCTTFFSVEYSDYYPVGNYKLIALIENLLNILFFAYIVGIVYSDLHDELKQENWLPLKDKAYEELRINLKNLLADIDMVFGITTELDAKGHPIEKYDKYKTIKLDEMRPEKKTQLSTGAYGDVFKVRAEYLGNYQTKYQEFLETEITLNAIGIQNLLINVDQDIRIFDKDELRRDEDKLQEIIDNLVQITQHIEQINNTFLSGQKKSIT